ncbi:hypothetical protein [Agromyces binzhouensis]|uniref:Uncharacterized protein n=1 Tax=Agromyces binzhouensis TaxID=1817495 RepID=A0A4Q2JJ53_9MICO|nr:hypothetical protein [Agromyces binzhouensis]RXZ48081.1 hypothetical protein ESO86_08310 [Agromyces binzhouensis]
MPSQICIEVDGKTLCFPLYEPVRRRWVDPFGPTPDPWGNIFGPHPEPWRDLVILDVLVDLARSLSERIDVRDELVQMAHGALTAAVEDLGVGAELRSVDRRAATD